MAFTPEAQPKPTGLESKTREELEALWDKADDSPAGSAGGFTQGQISEALSRLNHKEALSGENVPDSPLPTSNLPFKDSRGRIINYNILRMRREAVAAIRAKHPEDQEKERK